MFWLSNSSSIYGQWLQCLFWCFFSYKFTKHVPCFHAFVCWLFPTFSKFIRTGRNVSCFLLSEMATCASFIRSKMTVQCFFPFRDSSWQRSNFISAQKVMWHVLPYFFLTIGKSGYMKLSVSLSRNILMIHFVQVVFVSYWLWFICKPWSSNCYSVLIYLPSPLNEVSCTKWI